MSIKIVLPKSKDNVKSGCGTKVFIEDGVEITDILSMDIHVSPDDIITATLEICVNDVENFNSIAIGKIKYSWWRLLAKRLHIM